MLEDLDKLLASAPGLIASARSLDDLDTVESDLMGKRSLLAEVQRGMGAVEPDERPAIGKKLAEVRSAIRAMLDERRDQLASAQEEQLIASERLDVSVDRWRIPAGSRHLISQTIEDIIDIFIGLGYVVAEGPEAETAWYNFDALNTPPTHPARAETDTMYLDFGSPDDEVLLRTHTSPMQARWMERHDPPVYVVVPGKVYRSDVMDASHLPVFHQIEGLAVDRNITIADLKGTLAHFARAFFGPGTEVRLRPHFFPFTEPSAELDVSCFVCSGSDPSCRVCGGAGWIEMLGCGMVDPNVFTAVGYDPDEVTGFAFGMGVERMAMVRHGIDDVRYFVDNDPRFLRQFP